MRKPSEFSNFPPDLHPGFGPFIAVSRPDMRYDDGDSLWFWADKGFNDYAFIGVRLLGIDAPGTRAPEAKTAEDRAKGQAAKAFLLKELIPLDTPVLLRTEKDPEKYGRYLAVVFYMRDGEKRCANVDMVASLHADIREDWGWAHLIEHCRAEGVKLPAIG